jgi:hypothetical protein
VAFVLGGIAVVHAQFLCSIEELCGVCASGELEGAVELCPMRTAAGDSIRLIKSSGVLLIFHHLDAVLDQLPNCL